MHDEYIRAQGPGWEQQSKHRFAVSKQTVRGRRDFPIEAARDALYLNTHEYTQYSMSLCYSKKPLQNTNRDHHFFCTNT